MTSDTLSTIDKNLLRSLADGAFHSGTDLAQTLGLSRSAIWKHLQNLQALGLEVAAVSGKGYKLNPALQLLDTASINTHLSPASRSLISQIECFDQIHSTNRYLMDQAERTTDNGRVCLAEYQTAGRGRRGRQWVSPFGHNIYLSMLWRYASSPNVLSGLSLAVGLACARALQRFGVDGIGLKWPNDLYWQQRKLAGILVEVAGESAGPCHAVIGVGLNLYLPQQPAQQIEQAWVDLQHILGPDCLTRRNELAAYLIDALIAVLADYEQSGLGLYLDEWRNLDCIHGSQVQLQVGQQLIEGVAQGIDDQGLLIILDQTGQIRRYASGEVSVKPL